MVIWRVCSEIAETMGRGNMHTLFRNLSLALQITLVTNHDNGEIILVLHPQNLLLERHDFLETLSARDAVDQ